MNFKAFFCSFFLFIFLLSLNAQDVPSPKEFLGHSIGSKFTYHHQIVDYFTEVAELSERVRLVPYGKTYEGRELLIVVITSPKNQKNLEEIREANLKQAGLLEGSSNGKQLPIVWLSYNVHGDEAASSEAAILTLHHFASAQDKSTKEILEEMIIIMDPCINPDGRDRYANWYNQVMNFRPSPYANSQEHHQPWPGGRYNHYLYDLNRDWAWQTQKESQQRIALYNQWMPHVHVDYHEMGPSSPYFFAPAAHPYHEQITAWQGKFQEYVGQKNAAYFDQDGHLYYTREIFDLLYPSYGDTYPIFNGAVGFTYEKGGSKRAGIFWKKPTGDTLTLKLRANQHLLTGISTVETTFEHRAEMISSFNNYFKESAENKTGPYDGYLIKNNSKASNLPALLRLLDKQDISYTQVAGSTNLEGFSYSTGEEGKLSTEEGDIYISGKQAKSKLLHVLFEPKTMLEDSLTYDLTAWALPYAYGLDAYAITQGKTEGFNQAYSPQKVDVPSLENAYAVAIKWQNETDVRLLGDLLQQGIHIRVAYQAFESSGQYFNKGTLLITREDNRRKERDLWKMVEASAKKYAGVHISPIKSGMVAKGKDIGSDYMQLIKAPRVGIINGKGVNPMAFGDVWHYFEQQIEYPVEVLNSDYLSLVDLGDFDVLVLPSGTYSFLNKAELTTFVENGGRVIAMERALSFFSGDSNFKLGTPKSLEGGSDSEPIRFEDQERAALVYEVPGSIYKVTLDDSHPLAFGYTNELFIVKRNNQVFPYLKDGKWTVGYFEKNAEVSGFTGHLLEKRLPQSMAFGVEEKGAGTVTYFVDSPIFRGFWEGGKLLFANAVFLGGN